MAARLEKALLPAVDSAQLIYTHTPGHEIRIACFAANDFPFVTNNTASRQRQPRILQVTSKLIDCVMFHPRLNRLVQCTSSRHPVSCSPFRWFPAHVPCQTRGWESAWLSDDRLSHPADHMGTNSITKTAIPWKIKAFPWFRECGQARKTDLGDLVAILNITLSDRQKVHSL